MLHGNPQHPEEFQQQQAVYYYPAFNQQMPYQGPLPYQQQDTKDEEIASLKAQLTAWQQDHQNLQRLLQDAQACNAQQERTILKLRREEPKNWGEQVQRLATEMSACGLASIARASDGRVYYQTLMPMQTSQPMTKPVYANGHPQANGYQDFSQYTQASTTMPIMPTQGQMTSVYPNPHQNAYASSNANKQSFLQAPLQQQQTTLNISAQTHKEQQSANGRMPVAQVPARHSPPRDVTQPQRGSLLAESKRNTSKEPDAEPRSVNRTSEHKTQPLTKTPFAPTVKLETSLLSSVGKEKNFGQYYPSAALYHHQQPNGHKPSRNGPGGFYVPDKGKKAAQNGTQLQRPRTP